MTLPLADPMLRLAFLIDLLLLIVAVSLWFEVMVLQSLRRRRERLDEESRDYWRPLMVKALIESLTQRLPAILRRERMALLILWNRLHESVRGEGIEHLNRLGREAGLDKLALRLLHSRRLKWRLLAIRTLGNLRERDAWPGLQRELYASQPTSALAARALLQIDPDAALPLLVPLLCERDDWPVAQVGSFLREDEHGPLVCRHLEEALREAPAKYLPRLLRYVRSLDCADMTVTLNMLLDTHDDPNVIVPCLRAFNDPAALARIRGYLEHPSWVVRMQAVATLGRLAEPEDEQRLRERLADPNWWVRYRAAEALVDLPFAARDKLERLAAEHPDKFARDMLARALAHVTSV